MLKTRRHLSVGLLLFAFALLTAQASLPAQPANIIVASTNLRSAAKRDDSILAQRAVASLEQLKPDVLVYRSDGECDSDGKLACVPLETFTDKLNQATVEVESTLPQLSDVKLRSHPRNSLYSYCDGAFWWTKLDQKKVVTKTARLRVGYRTSTPAEPLLSVHCRVHGSRPLASGKLVLASCRRLIVGANTSVSDSAVSLHQNRKFH